MYPLFLSGWASNRKYALLGAVRGVAQGVSYEVRLALVLFGIFVLRPSILVAEAASSQVVGRLA